MDMCAIAGAVRLHMDNAIQEKMLDTMKRRGPDEWGVFHRDDCTLLHSRLTIIDPSGGKQPMDLRYGNEDYTMIYNGELYNTEELRDELRQLGHAFRGHSDTEVMLHAYVQWKEAALERANGIFGFAVWEHKRKSLFLARDRMGVKPLFYKLHDGGLLFASEIKTILTYPTVSAEIDATGAAELLFLGPGRTPGSGVFRGIQELEPGCCGRYEAGKWTWRRYWKLMDRQHSDSFATTADTVRYLVTDAIKRQLVSDFPVGTFLSGGLDSSVISAVAANVLSKRGAQLQTFSLDYKNNDKFFVPEKFQPESDNAYVFQMQQYLDTDSYWTVLSPEDLVHALENATHARDLPGMADVDISLLLFCQQIRNSVKVALSGECADEIFGGYPWYRDPAIRDADGFPWAQNTKQRAGFAADWITDTVDPASFVADRYSQTVLQSDILPGTSQQEKRLKQMVNLNYMWFMQTLLDRKDRMSMYCGLEVRVPFCDYRIAEYLYGVPWEFKEYNGQEKGLLRHAMRGIIPDTVLYRKKSPYPKTYDPRYLDMVQKRLSKVMEDCNAPIFQLVKKEALENLLTSEYAWPWYGQLMRVPQTIAYMLQLNYWLDAYQVNIV